MEKHDNSPMLADRRSIIKKEADGNCWQVCPPAAPAVDAYWLFHTTCRKNQTTHDWEPWTPTIYLLINIVAQVLIMHKYVSQCELVGL